MGPGALGGPGRALGRGSGGSGGGRGVAGPLIPIGPIDPHWIHFVHFVLPTVDPHSYGSAGSILFGEAWLTGAVHGGLRTCFWASS